MAGAGRVHRLRREVGVDTSFESARPNVNATTRERQAHDPEHKEREAQGRAVSRALGRIESDRGSIKERGIGETGGELSIQHTEPKVDNQHYHHYGHRRSAIGDASIQARNEGTSLELGLVLHRYLSSSYLRVDGPGRY
jgi:hypothetical protein